MFFNDTIKSEIIIDTDAVKWNKTVDNERKTFYSGSKNGVNDKKLKRRATQRLKLTTTQTTDNIRTKSGALTK